MNLINYLPAFGLGLILGCACTLVAVKLPHSEAVALGAVIVAFIAVCAQLMVARKQVRASFVQERLQRIRDELSRFSGNASYLLFDSTLQGRNPEVLAHQLHGLFLQEASVRVGLSSENETQANLAGTLREILEKLPAATKGDDPATKEVVSLLRRATLEFHDIRAKEEAKV